MQEISESNRQCGAGVSNLCVRNENGLLRQVVVNFPETALEAVSPEQAQQLLFDDILDVPRARSEFGVLVACMQKVTGPSGVLFLEALFGETIDACSHLKKILALDIGIHQEMGDPEALSTTDFVNCVFSGKLDGRVIANPIPNSMFTRDMAAVVGDKIFLSLFAKVPRMREAIVMKAILQYHPVYSLSKDHLILPQEPYNMEGGDVFPLREDLLMVGVSERTKLETILSLCRTSLFDLGIRNILAVSMPRDRMCMHLDTIYSQINDGDFVVYKPLIEPSNGQVGVKVLALTLSENGSVKIGEFPSLLTAFDHYKVPVNNLISCGGHDRLIQDREQRWEGSNLFTLRPGLTLIPDCNYATIEELCRVGYEFVQADRFIDPTFEIRDKQRYVVAVPCPQLLLGHGGFHCMTQPWQRNSIEGKNP